MAIPQDFQQKLQALRVRYLLDLPGKIDELEAAVSSAGEDVDLWLIPQRMAHSLAGSGATFGVPPITVLGRKIEHIIMQRREKAAVPGPSDRHDISLALADMRAVFSEQAEGPVAPSIRSAPAEPGQPRRKLVIVEDEQGLADDLALQLGYFGYDTQHFLSPLALVEAGLPSETTAIIFDVSFPEGETAGPDIAIAHGNTVFNGIPILFMSSNDGMDARLKAVRAGGKAYLSKPVDITTLVTQLDQLTGSFASRAIKVLVVEDPAASTQDYVQLLEAAGIKTQTLAQAVNINTALSEFQPDLLLLEASMRNCNAVELVKVIRQQEAHVGLPIVYIATPEQAALQSEVMLAGADDFLREPLHSDDLIASIKARAIRHAQLRSYIFRDGLTNLLNHTRLREALDVELSRAARSSKPLALVMIDLDEFKSVNDRFGHPVGDQVLRSLARLLNQRLRKTDIAGRYGGEEFAIVLPDTDGATAVRVINTLREDFARIRHIAGSTEFKVSFSAGVAEFPLVSGLDAITRAADAALYEAKRRGRNRVELSVY